MSLIISQVGSHLKIDMNDKIFKLLKQDIIEVDRNGIVVLKKNKQCNLMKLPKLE